jgi:hypothetical protein
MIFELTNIIWDGRTVPHEADNVIDMTFDPPIKLGTLEEVDGLSYHYDEGYIEGWYGDEDDPRWTRKITKATQGYIEFDDKEE